MVEWNEGVPTGTVVSALRVVNSKSVLGGRLVRGDMAPFGAYWLVRWKFDTPEETLAADEVMLNLVRARYGGSHAP